MFKRVALAVGLAFLIAGAAFGARAWLIHELRKPILAQLNDPDSAQFRAERVYGNWTPAGSALCGEVNAKNAMGGYVGYAPFEAGVAQGSIERPEDLLKACEFEPDAKAQSAWWHLRW